MRKLIFGLVAAAFAALSPALCAAVSIKPGMWEMTTIVSGQRTASEQKCFLQKDLDELEKKQRGAPTKEACIYSDYKESGKTVTYKMTCKFGGGNPTIILVSTTYNGDTATGTVTSNGAVSTMNSKRVGNCTKSSFDK